MNTYLMQSKPFLISSTRWNLGGMDMSGRLLLGGELGALINSIANKLEFIGNKINDSPAAKHL